MSTESYGGYGIKSWGGATPIGPVEIPQLGGAPAVAPKFKPKNELAGYAAKMVGELAYGAMAEEMAPQHIGYNEILGKDVFRIQPGSQQFAGEGGWDAGPNGVFEYQVPGLLKKHDIAEMEKVVEFNKIFEPSITKQTAEDEMKAQQIRMLPRPLTLAQAQEFEGFDPSIVQSPVIVEDDSIGDIQHFYPKSTTSSADQERLSEFETNWFPETSGASIYMAKQKEMGVLRDRIMTAAKPHKPSLGEKWWFDEWMSAEDKKLHLIKEGFTRWANDMSSDSGAGQHFYPRGGAPNYKALELYEKNPLEYWKKFINTK